jgi:hypothetical protein
MIVVDQPLRTTRRPRRMCSVSAPFGAPGPVRNTDRPLDRAASSSSEAERLHCGPETRARAGRRQAGIPPGSR